MKRFRFLIVVCLTAFVLRVHPVYSQSTVTLSGKVIDKSTSEPLVYASIYLVGTSFGTTTNHDGEFVFRIPADAKSRLVAISYLGYAPQWIKLEDSTDAFQRIALEAQPFALSEVVIRPDDPLDIIYRSIEKIPENYNSNAYAAQGFQREYITAGRNFIQFLEVVFETKGTTESQTSSVLDARYIEDKKEKAPLWSASRGGFYTFGWTAISGIETPSPKRFLGVEVKKKSDLATVYEFQWREPIRLENREVYVIAFDQKERIKNPLLKGLLYVDSKSLAIVKLTYELSPRGLSFIKSHETWGGVKVSKPPKKIDVAQERGEIVYKEYGKKWYLNTLIINTEFDASLVFFGVIQSQKNSLKFHSERIITAIDTARHPDLAVPTNIAAVGSIPTLQNFIKKEYEKYDETNDEKWSNFNFLKSDTSVATLAKQLRFNNQQWELENRKKIAARIIATSAYTARQLSEDLDYLKKTLEEVHPGLNWYTEKTNLTRELDLVRSRLNKKNSEAEFFRLLSPWIAQIHCGHTELYPSLVTTEYYALRNELFPLDLWIGNDSAIVVKGYETISKGSKVESINGHLITAVTRRLTSAVPSDGHNTTYTKFRIRTEFPTLYQRFFGAADTFSIKLADSGRQTKDIMISGKVSMHEIPPDTATYQSYDSLNAMMLKIPSFSTDQNFPAFLNQTFKKIENKRVKHLIIDLRNNSGGRDEYGALLYSYLTDKPFAYYRRITVASADTSFLSRLSFGDIPFNKAQPDYLSHLQKRDSLYSFKDHPNLNTQTPKQNAYMERVYILMNGGTFSSAAEFAAIAYTNNRAIFIGEEAGGGYYGNCSLGTPMLTLPNSRLRIAIPLAKYELAVSGNVPEGHGVIPKHKTVYYSKDILSNTDKDLELCLKLIREVKP